MTDRTGQSDALRMVQVVLHWAWDPIGIRGIEAAADEYDSYALAVLEMLRGRATSHEIADYLVHVEREAMGLEPNRDRNADVAAMLVELQAIAR